MEYGRIEADRLGKHSPEVPAFFNLQGGINVKELQLSMAATLTRKRHVFL